MASDNAENDNSREMRFENCSCCDPPFMLNSLDWADSVYSMNYPKKGLCLIFSHSEFQPRTNQRDRKGTDCDVELLQYLFEKLKFEVCVYPDFTVEDIEKTLNTVSQLDYLANYGCFVCCIMTHGHGYEDLYAADEHYSLDSMLSYFRSNKCDSLKGKPKIFIIQACSGEDEDYGQKVIIQKKGIGRLARCHSNQSDNMEEVSVESTDKDKKTSLSYPIPPYSDFLIIRSSFYGFYSYRNKKEGSQFIKKFCDKIESEHFKMDLISILTLINREMAYEFQSTSRKKQMPFYKSSLTKMIRF